jgi:4-diphosphocytidyl-2-C-methyl-D-erythritol kinase
MVFLHKIEEMVVFPKAKINLGLRITGKRHDGYHDLETIFYPVSLCDALEFVVSQDASKNDILTVTGIDTGGDPRDNLVSKTVRRLRVKYKFPILRIHLHKVIPFGAGLGGGSSDSASLLKSVNRCFRLGISEKELKSISLEMGSDCPFFIDGIPAYATGRGEVLSPVNVVLKGYYLVLLNPGIVVNTREAYQNCSPGKTSTILRDNITRPVTEWKDLIINDFEDVVFTKHPEIGGLKNDLYRSGALFSLMSGSGSSVYGIFRGKPELPDHLRGSIIYEGIM